MFDSPIAINEFQCEQLAKVAENFDDTMLYSRSPGHGHPPVWVLGHLVLTGEMGQRMLGGRITHKKWLRLFGPESSDDPSVLLDANDRLGLDELLPAIDQAYAELRDLASKHSSDSVTSQPHGVELLANSRIGTVGDMITHLLTSHFGLHLAQLSSCRRNLGHKPLF